MPDLVRFSLAGTTAPSVILALALALSGASDALAGDGRTEINQARAIAGGVAPGDGVGFPVTIVDEGSYVLTGNLDAASQTAIEVVGNHVSIDLNGFTIQGFGGSSPGISALASFRNTTVRNGSVVGFGGVGIDLNTGAHVEGVVVDGCLGGGVLVGDRSLVTSSRILASGVNGTVGGLSLGATSGYRDVVLVANSPHNVKGGSALGSLCDGKQCASPPRRRFYLTQGAHDGATADEACAEGFHLASIWEIWDPSNLEYDTALGFVLNPTNPEPGPPALAESTIFGSFILEAWVRWSGLTDLACEDWTSSNPGALGRTATLPSNFDFTLPDASGSDPWIQDVTSCDTELPAWCVQD